MSQVKSAEKSGPLSHKEIMIVLSGLMMGMLLAALDQTIVSTALKKIVEDFSGLNHYTWVVTAYLLTSTASTPLYGKISDLYGRRPIFQFAIITFLIGSFAAGAAQSMTQLIAFRALQGLGAGGLMSLTFVIIGDIVSPRERGRYQGYFGALLRRRTTAWRLVL
jgi:MFS family permease